MIFFCFELKILEFTDFKDIGGILFGCFQVNIANGWGYIYIYTNMYTFEPTRKNTKSSFSWKIQKFEDLFGKFEN